MFTSFHNKNQNHASLAQLSFASFVMVAALSGCTGAHEASSHSSAARAASSSVAHQPVVSAIKTDAVAGPSSAAVRLAALKLKHSGRLSARFDAPVATAAAQMSAEVTLNKAEILGRDFLYNADLQYSSLGDKNLSLMLQSLVVGQVPARLNIVGSNLELVADQTRLFQSDIDHPGRLINSFPIVKQDATTVTITVSQASPTLVPALAQSNEGTPAEMRSSWVRSVEFVPQGDYLMMETSIELVDGSIAEFMESVFPRENLVPKNYKPLLADPNLEPLAERYRFLGGDPLYLDLPDKGRTKTLVASRFNLGPTDVIDWYVTPNAPAQYLPLIKTAVEGWNRYSQKMWNRDFIRFKGVLPDGIKIGDPRYNVINWDSVPDAGAAYESQATDPTTGIQSHSLIYLPFAWVKIGADYWKMGAPANDDRTTAATVDALTEAMTSRLQAALNNVSFLGFGVKNRCLNNVELAVSLEARRTPEVFARELTKDTLFHEVGHSFGLAHNFKGSLSWNPEDPKSIFSSSIMDYNQYEVEANAFTSETSSDGPLLEYDRQIISVLYNSGKDVAVTDPVLPACEDHQADDMSGGVDPTCLRYDSGEDPSKQVLRTIALIKNKDAKLGPLKSFAAALDELNTTLVDPSKVKTSDDAIKALAEYEGQIAGLAKYYLISGAQSLRYMTVANLKALYDFRDDVTLAGPEKSAYISRVIEALNYSANVATLEAPEHEALVNLARTAAKWIQATPWFQTGADRDEKLPMIVKSLSDLEINVTAVTLPALRAKVVAALVRNASTPFYFSTTDVPARDLEKSVLDLLESVVTQPLTTRDGALMKRSAAERLAAAQSLATFKGIVAGQEAITRVRNYLNSAVTMAKSSQERQAYRIMAAALDAKPAAAK
jgi:hypothetical protein